MMPPLPSARRAERESAAATRPPVVAWIVGVRPSRAAILCGELERARRLLTRYALAAIASVVLFGCMFLVFAYLGTVMEGRLSPFGATPRVLAALYVVWVIVSTTIGGSTGQLAGDAAIGVLETLFLGAAPIERVLEMRAAAQALQGCAMGALLLLAFCLGTHWLPSPTVLATLIVAVLACTLTSVGFALALAGAVLLTKRVGALMIPVNFLCMLAVMGGPARDAGQPNQ
jgi:hypothetical protein